MLITLQGGDSSIIDSIFWLPGEVAKCVIFLLKINTGMEAFRTAVQKTSSEILHVQGAQGRDQASVGGERRWGQRKDVFSLGSL